MIHDYAICDDCWHKNWPTQVPYRMTYAERKTEICALCGWHTFAGIYRRMDIAEEMS